MPARILVIEDNPANLYLMAYLLRAYGHTVHTSVDGEAGLDQVERQPPDLVVCDLQLPGMDGFEVVRRLKGQPARATIPVVAVTALAMVGDREKVLAAGFDGYISKPIDPETFLPQIEAFLSQPGTARPQPVHAPAADSPSPAARRGRLLVVDDRPVNLSLTRSIFEPAGFEVLTAAGQAEALALARQCPPALIICDVMMLDGNGIDFVQAVRADSQLATIPVVLLTSTCCDEKSRARGLAAGAARYLFRPIEPELLLAEVEAVLREQQRG